MIGPEPALAPLKAEAQGLWEVANRRVKFRRLRDQAYYQQLLFTAADPAKNRAVLETIVRDALKLYKVSPDSETTSKVDGEPQQAEIVTGCYELLLTLAEVVAQPSLGQAADDLRDRTGQALKILERAARFGPPTRAYHLRRARYLTQLNDENGAQDEREQAETIWQSTAAKAIRATDYFLLGTDGQTWNRPNQAIGYFEEALRLQPGHIGARYGRAGSYLRMQRWDAAKVALTDCLDRQSDLTWIYPLRAIAHLQLKEYLAAEEDCDTAAQRLKAHEAAKVNQATADGHGPDESNWYGLYLCRGALRLHQGKLDDAFKDFHAAIKLRPDSYQAHLNLGLAYKQQDKLPEAAAHFDKAIQLEPSLASLYWERGRISLRRHDYAAALKDAERAIELEDEELKRLAQMPPPHEEAPKVRPDYAAAHRLRAHALILQAGDDDDEARQLDYYRKAFDSLDRCLKTTDMPRASDYRDRAVLRAKLGNCARAVDDYTLALELEPNSATRAKRGWMYLAAFQTWPLALLDFEWAIRLDPQNGDAYNGRGFVRLKLGQGPEVAVADAEKALETAVADAEEALRLGPETPEMLYNTARIFALAAGELRRRA
jgi:tetratricopeptide (TPR) repeat protein